MCPQRAIFLNYPHFVHTSQTGRLHLCELDLLPKIRAEVYMNTADCGEEGAWRRGSIAKWR
jgi:hypothetical protein